MNTQTVAVKAAMRWACGAALAVSGSGLAQEQPAAQPLPAAPAGQAPATAQPPPANDAPHQIEEVVVTATKRRKSVRDIPASIAAIDGASLEDHGQLNLDDFIHTVSGVTAAQGAPGVTRITMRGITADAAPGSPTPSPVGIFIGDTAFTDPYISGIVPDLSAFDLAGVQVLKGPQGTLFGGEALSGAVRYELQEPVLGQWQARAFSQMVSPDGGNIAYTSGAAANLPLLRDDLALRVAFVRRDYPGLYTDSRSGDKGVDRGSGNQVRAILLWQPQDWKFKLTHLAQDFGADNALTNADNPRGPRASGVYIIPQPVDNRFNLDSGEINRDFDGFRLVSLSSFLEKHAHLVADATFGLVGSPPPGYPTDLALVNGVTEDSRAYSQELRLQSTGSGPLQWLVGAYYYKSFLRFVQDTDTPVSMALISPGAPLSSLGGLVENSPGPLLNQENALLYAVSDTSSRECATFFDLSYKPWTPLELDAGARFYWTSTGGGFQATGILLRAENNLMDANTVNSLFERGISPRFTATYHFTRDISLYGQASRGFRFGGVQYEPSTPTNGVPPTYKSDSLWNYEMGLRTSWFHHTLLADLTAFYDRYKNPIITQTTPGVPINFVTNVSGAISQGLEANVQWNTPIYGLSTQLTGSLNDAHITTPFTASSGATVATGQQMPGTARAQYSAALNYLLPLWKFDLAPSLSYSYIGKGYGDIIHSVPINDYGSLGAGLVISSEVLPMHPKLAINGTNLLDTTRATSGGSGKTLLTGQEIYQYTLNQPRTISARLSLDF